MPFTVGISNFTIGPYSPSAPASWTHLAESGKTIYAIATYLTYAGEDVLSATFGGVPMTKQSVTVVQAGQFHTTEIFSLVNPTAGSGTIQISGAGLVRMASFNIENGPVDGCVVGVSSSMSGVTTRHLYGAGYNTDDLIIGWFEVYNPQFAPTYTVTDGTQLYSATRHAVGYKHGDGTETKISFDTGGDTAGGEQMGLIFTIPNAGRALSKGERGSYMPWMSRVQNVNTEGCFCLPHATASIPSGANMQSIGIPTDCTIRNLRIDLKNAPGVGNSRTFRIYKNGVKTGLGPITISGTNTTATITGVDLKCYQWSTLEVRHTLTGSPAFTQLTYCVEYESAEDGVSVYGPFGYYESIPGSPGRSNPFGPASTPTFTTNRYDEGRVGCNGSLIGIGVGYNQEIGQSRYDLYVWKSTDDGVTYIRQDGTGGTVDTHKMLTQPFGAAQPGGSGWFLPMDLPLNVGDMVYVEITAISNPDGGLGARMVVFSAFRATTNGEWFFNGETTNGADFIYSPHQNWIANPDSEFNANYTVGPLTNTFSVTGINWAVQTPPGSSRTITLRHNETSTSIAPTISGGARSAQAGGSEVFAVGDRFCVTFSHTGSPNGITAMWWTIRGFIQPPLDGVLIVQKVVEGRPTVLQFTVDVGGGLTPDQLLLGDGDSHTYDPVTPRSGYTVDEDPPLGWGVTGIVVSNASPSDNISVGEGETVTVTITNARLGIDGCPEGMPLSPAQGAEGCTHTLDVD